MKRQLFIKKGLLGTGMLLAAPNLIAGEANSVFDKEEIKDFVYAAHNDFDATKKIIETKPLLLNCTNQGKKGDFETAVGGASHMGRKDIADLLIAKGARLDIFNYTFLGYSEFVKKLITDFPDLINAPGPHGFTLLHHAKVGKQDDLALWLEGKGLKRTFFKDAFPLTN